MHETIIVNSSFGSKLLVPGRIVVVNNGQYLNNLAIISKDYQDKTERSFYIAILGEQHCSCGDAVPFTRLVIPSLNNAKLDWITISWAQILTITTNKLSVYETTNHDEILTQLIEFGSKVCSNDHLFANNPFSIHLQHRINELNYTTKIKDLGICNY